MRSGSVTTKRRRGNFSTAEAVRAMIASAALAGILLLAFFVTTGPYFAADRQAQNAVPKIAPLSPSNGGSPLTALRPLWSRPTRKAAAKNAVSTTAREDRRCDCGRL
jgi:hypothetical protein